MVCLENAILVRPELFQLDFEYGILLVGNGLLVENENVGDVVVMHLQVC